MVSGEHGDDDEDRPLIIIPPKRRLIAKEDRVKIRE